jgi:hypothetical protein
MTRLISDLKLDLGPELIYTKRLLRHLYLAFCMAFIFLIFPRKQKVQQWLVALETLHRGPTQDFLGLCWGGRQTLLDCCHY